MTRTISTDHNVPTANTQRSEYCQIRITGLTCAGDAVGLERRLQRLNGVVTAMVNPITEQAYVDFDPAVTNIGNLVTAITAAGYGTG